MCVADLKLPLLGHHQLDNAAAAIAAAHIVREQGLGSITHDSLVEGLQQTMLPGRLQVCCLTRQVAYGASGVTKRPTCSLLAWMLISLQTSVMCICSHCLVTVCSHCT